MYVSNEGCNHLTYLSNVQMTKQYFYSAKLTTAPYCILTAPYCTLTAPCTATSRHELRVRFLLLVITTLVQRRCKVRRRCCPLLTFTQRIDKQPQCFCHSLNPSAIGSTDRNDRDVCVFLQQLQLLCSFFTGIHLVCAYHGRPLRQT